MNEKNRSLHETRTRKAAKVGFGQIRAEGSTEAPVIEAYFAVFGDRYEFDTGCYETIDPAAFDGQLNGDIRALADHDTRIVLGRTTAGTLELQADSKGLRGLIRINPKDTDAMNVYQRVLRGDVSGCSFGFDIIDEEFRQEADGSNHWIIKKLKLFEVSVVTFPAYEDTIAEARSTRAKNLSREYARNRLEHWKETTINKLREARERNQNK